MHPSHDAPHVTRRTFLKSTSTAVGAAALAATAAGTGTGTAEAGFWRGGKGLIHAKDTILFQGDSITDAGRSRSKEGEANDPAGLASGYAGLAAGFVLAARPGDGLRIFNRGISGHKVYQLAERWQRDCLDLQPSVLSVLIGVNDIWHMLAGNYNGTLEVYERDYRALLARTRQALPKVRLVVCEPFVLRCGAVTDKWFPLFNDYRAAARRVAQAHGATFVPFQAMFDAAVKYAPPEYWAKDGVHPSAAGAALMAHTWVNAVNAV